MSATPPLPSNARPRQVARKSARSSQAASDLVIFIVSDRHHRVRRIRLSRRRIKQSLAGLVMLCALILGLAVHDRIASQKAAQLDSLVQRHADLNNQARATRRELQLLDQQFSALERQLSRVRAITQLNDPARNLAMDPLVARETSSSPVLYLHGERTDTEDELMDSQSARRLLEQSLEESRASAARTSTLAREINDFVSRRPQVVAYTPSIYPVASRLLTSRFGPRRDAFTGQDVWHKGVDFASDLGAPIWAPADGRVVFAGPRGQGLGEVLVLDHGFSVQTHFAHLQSFDVKPGDRVQRGQQIARVGNSGRSTGPHLHYEIRMAGLPQDPEPYLLD